MHRHLTESVRDQEVVERPAGCSNGARADLHAAFHEAGHFVAHHHLVPSELAIEIALLGGGAGVYAPGDVVDREKLRERATALYAGAAADLILDPSIEDAVRAHARDDDVEAARWLGRCGEPHGEMTYRRRAESVVKEHWREIEAIAAVLLEVDALRGDVAKMILDLVNGVELPTAADRLALPRGAAMAIARAFAMRVTPDHVAAVLARHGYDVRRRASQAAAS